MSIMNTLCSFDDCRTGWPHLRVICEARSAYASLYRQSSFLRFIFPSKLFKWLSDLRTPCYFERLLLSHPLLLWHKWWPHTRVFRLALCFPTSSFFDSETSPGSHNYSNSLPTASGSVEPWPPYLPPLQTFATEVSILLK